ncbi:hypothetical protein [Symbiopectobacterium sp. RP]|uniref:hypothetical protein n=1 Tax=Symbiopectobacterium sp. RP TaxID=3248553 RepID=UPI003D278E2E
MGTSKKQKRREWLRYRDFVLSPYGVIKIKSLGYIFHWQQNEVNTLSVNPAIAISHRIAPKKMAISRVFPLNSSFHPLPAMV